MGRIKKDVPKNVFSVLREWDWLVDNLLNKFVGSIEGTR